MRLRRRRFPDDSSNRQGNGEEVKRSFDRTDLYSAFGLFAVIAAWAFIWAYPYPHPDLWSFLVDLQWKTGPALLRAAGSLELGVFAAFVYLDLRGLWFTYRHEFDDLPDEFFFTRTAPICGAALFALLPYSWRSAQSLSLGFALLVLTLLGFFLWFLGRGGRSSRAYSLSFLLFGFVSGLNPLGFAPLGFAVFSDIVIRRNYMYGFVERDGDVVSPRKMLSEKWFSFLAGTLGFTFGACLLAAKVPLWLKAWMGVAVRSAFSPGTVAIALSVLVAAIVIVIGRYIRLHRHYGFVKCRVLSCLLALAAFAMFLLAADRPTRIRLQADTCRDPQERVP